MAIVEPKCHFVEVGRKVFCRDFVPRSHDPAVEQRKRRLNPVSPNVAFHVNALAVIDRFMWDAKDPSRSSGATDSRAGRPCPGADAGGAGRADGD